ncbi:MAG TPA: hypothetical protein VNM14_02445 [Planctomycetota bacterium]|jgi:hypothetical protein|nr:hypothetical protein [Planctomycetota bacterium]
MRPLTLALLVLLVQPQDKGLRKIEWKLGAGHVAEYVFLDKAGKPLPDQKFLIFGSELTGHSNRILVDSYDELPLPLLFQLPPEPFKNGVGWEFTANFFSDSVDAMGGFETMIGGGSIRPVCAKGRYVLKVAKKGDDEIATVDGAFSLFEIRRDFVNNQMKLVATKNEMGTLATSAQVSVSKGIVLKAAWQYKVRGQERENGRPVEKKIETHGMVEFREDVELDAAKIQASIETAISRAADWLKKQQKNGAWTPTRGQPQPADTLHLTALAVRALSAAGVKPDDPVLVAASRTLRSPAPVENAFLGQQILALCGKSPTKDEADDARRLAEELLRRRDPRIGGWGPGTGRNDTPNLTLTALALEALAAVPDAKVPEDVFKTGLDNFSAAWIDEEGSVDLDVEFEKDAAPFPLDPKKNVVPAAWPAQLGRAGPLGFGGARKGSFFTQVAALRTLLLVPEKLKVDEKQLKALEAPLRKGFANLQRLWTLRTVPPVEAPWCSQRLEYLGILGPMLSRAKINRIGGSDWRLEGATLLLREQGDDGSWYAGTDWAVAKTAHALLFLASAKR